MKKSSVVFYFVYLFMYFQLAPAFESIEWKEENRIDKKESHDLIPVSANLRPKRFIWSVLAFIAVVLVQVATGVATSVISEVIIREIYGDRKRRSIDDKNPAMINRLINNDIAAVKKIKKMMMKMDPGAGKMIEVSGEGFRCDEAFCSTRDGLYGMGFCTPYSCRCRNHTAVLLTCKTGQMFNPSNSRCQSSLKIAFCGH